MKRRQPPRPKFRRVEFFRKADGSKPVAEWLNSLDDDRAQAVAMGIRFFEEYPGQVPKKFFEKISEHIWEIKTHRGKEQFRILAFPYGDAIVVAVLADAKKTRKLDRDLIDLAEDRYAEYVARMMLKRS